MFRKHFFPVLIVSGILFIYCLVIYLNILIPVAFLIFTVSPILLIWMVYMTIRYGSYHGKELDEGEEWGYQDKKKDELGIF